MVEQQPSKLNTRVRFPSPAPMFSDTSCIIVSPFGQDGWCSFGQMTAFCSRSATFLGPSGHLPRCSLDVFGQHLGGFVPTLRHQFAVGQFSVAAFGETAMTE